MDANWILIFIGLGFILLELLLGVATGFDLLLIGLSLTLGGLTGIATSSDQIGVISSAIFTVLYFLIGRKLIKSKLSVLTTKTNIDNLIGKIGVVTKADQIKIDTEIWRYKSTDSLKSGDKAKVVAIEGNTVEVVRSN